MEILVEAMRWVRDVGVIMILTIATVEVAILLVLCSQQA